MNNPGRESYSFIIRSLSTLAITEAAAIDTLFESPFMIDVCGMRDGSFIASTNKCSGLICKDSIDFIIAILVAS